MIKKGDTITSSEIFKKEPKVKKFKIDKEILSFYKEFQNSLKEGNVKTSLSYLFNEDEVKTWKYR